MANIQIVFVHLNTQVPLHLIENVRRTKELFPDIQVHLVGNLECTLPKDLESNFMLVSTDSFKEILLSHTWDTGFRNGFWQSSLMRLLVLSEVHKIIGGSPILHVESDVILLPGFPFDEITKSPLGMWNKFNQTTDVGAIVFLPDLEASIFLFDSLTYILKEDPSVTDMTALSRVRQLHPNRFSVFPSSITDDDYAALPFIFDGAIYGMWIFGQDPRNHYGFQPRFRNLPESTYGLAKGDVYFNERGLLVLLEGSIESPIVSLHLHCKDTRLFSLKSRLFQKRIHSCSRAWNIGLIRPTVFLNLLLSAFKQKQFKAYVYNFPILGRIIRLIRKLIKLLVN